MEQIEKKSGDGTEVPKISKTLPIIKWSEAFKDMLHRKIGVRNVALAYVARLDAAVPPIGPQAAGTPHSTEHGSIEMELIARASHGHALFREDNSELYYLLEEATRGTPYAPSIKPFQRAKDGRGAWFALINQYAGKDKWEAEIKRHEKFMHTTFWKGQSNFSLERFITQHRNAFVSLQAAAEHVTYQLPNEHSRVGYVLDAIMCNDAPLQAAMASIKTDQTPGGLRNDFEATATHLLPYDPVQNKREHHAGGKRAAADISDMTGEETNVSSFGTKKGTGSTGVSLRYHTREEYVKLSDAQQDELREWRNGTKKAAGFKGKSGKPKPREKSTKDMTSAAIASAVKKQVAERMKSLERDKANEGVTEAYIMSIFEKFLSDAGAAASTKVQISDVGKRLKEFQISDVEVAPRLPSLKSILNRAQNGKK
jgi:hypothetical protein